MDPMLKRHELTKFENDEIVEGCKFFKQAEVAHDLKISSQTILTFLSRTEKCKSINNLPCSGVPQKLRNSDVCYLVHTVKSETHVPLTEIAVNTTFFNVSTQTLHQQLHEEGIRKWKTVERCLLTNKDAKAHYKWAKEHRYLTEKN